MTKMAFRYDTYDLAELLREEDLPDVLIPALKENGVDQPMPVSNF